MKHLTLVMLALVTLISCKPKDVEEPSIGTDYVGQWKLTGFVCNGQSIALGGFQEFLELTESTGRLMDIGSACYIMGDNMHVVPEGLTVTVAGGTASCIPSSCKIPYTSQMGASKNTSVISCTSGVSAGGVTFMMEEGKLVSTVVEPNVTCKVSYTRINNMPAKECLTEDNGSFSAITSSYMGITANNTDKGAMQFQVNTARSLRAIKLMMTSPGLTSARMQLYAGGSTPDTGTLLSTVTKTDALGFTAQELHVFELSPAVALSAGVDYYLIFSGVAASGSFSINMNTSGLILNGQAWTHSSGWTAVAPDFNMGFVYAGSGCL